MEKKEREFKYLKITSDITVKWEKGKSKFTIEHISENKINEKKKDLITIKTIDKIVDILEINENTILIWNESKLLEIYDISGKKINTIETQQNKEFLSIKIFKNSILTISKNESLILTDIDGNEIYMINEGIDSVDKFQLDKKFLQVKISNSLNMYNKVNGKSVYKLKNEKNFIEDLKLLSNKLLTTDDESKIKLWNDSGTLIKEFKNYKFEFEHVIETKNQELIILTEDNILNITDYKGELISSYNPQDYETIESFKDFIEAKTELDDKRQNKNKIEFYSHRSNPYERTFIPKYEDVYKKLNFEDSKKVFLWNFFNRPDFYSIKNILIDEEFETKKYKELLNNSTEKIEEQISAKEKSLASLKSSASNLMFFGLFSLIAALGIGFGVSGWGFAVIVVSVMIFMNYSAKKNEISLLEKRINVLQNEIKTIKVFYPEMNDFISDVKKFRRDIIKQIPFLSEPTLYTGSKVNEIINEKINNHIHKNALKYCGLVEDDIVHEEKKPIILNDGSMLQSRISNRIEDHNLNSFWRVDNGTISFAVQYLQFIFLTKEKIDIFSCHYDFILDEFTTKEAESFYYKDVTTISKKEVERTLLTSTNSIATEISLKVSSGDKIDFTIFSDETVKILNQKSDSNIEEKILELENEKLEVQNDNYDDEEKTNDLRDIDLQIQAIKQSSNLNENDNFSDEEVNKSIQNIRKHVNKFKN